MAQVLTDPHLQLSSLSRADFEALEDQWTSVTAAMVRQEFKPERWLQREGKGGDMQKPSGLLTFRCGVTVVWGTAPVVTCSTSLAPGALVVKCSGPLGCWVGVQGCHNHSVQVGWLGVVL